MIKKFFLLALLLLIPTATALHNDIGNDSCLTLYSDKAVYVLSPWNRKLEMELTARNNCGSTIPDLDFGVFFPKEYENLVGLESLNLLKAGKITEIDLRYDCQETLTTDGKIATCSKLDVNGTELIWQASYDRIEGKTAIRASLSQEPDYWEPITTSNISLSAVSPGDNNRLVYSWEDFESKTGDTKIKVVFNVPLLDAVKKEVVFYAESLSQPSRKSTLDPTWFDANYSSAYAINNLVITEDLNATSSVSLTGLDLTNFNFNCADANDFTIVNDLTGTEVTDLNFYNFNGTSGDTSIDLNFLLTDSLAAATYNGRYYIYTNSSTCYLPPNRVWGELGSIDTFEDGDYTTAPYWFLTDPGEAVVDVDASGAFKGSLGLRFTDNGDGDGSEANVKYYLDESPNYAFTTRAYFMSTDVSQWSTFEINDVPGFQLNCQIRIKADTITYSAAQTMTLTPLDNVWYLFEIKHDPAITKCIFTVYNAYTNQLLESRVASANSNQPPGVIYLDIHDQVNSGTTWYTYFDDVMYRPSFNSSYALGSEELGNTTPDLNIEFVDGESARALISAMSYSKDGNLTIDFNVFDADNDRLRIDLNYSDLNSSGKGTVIISDLNLNSDVCPVQDWDVSPSTCSWDFNIFGLKDQNIYVTADVNDGSASLFASTDFNFIVDNNAPFITDYWPKLAKSTSSSSVDFVFYTADYTRGSKVYIGFYLNGALDYNTTADINSDDIAKITYPFLNGLNDFVCAVAWQTEDDLVNKGLRLQGTECWQRTIMNVIDPINIQQEDLSLAFKGLVASIFIKLGDYFVPIFFFFLGLLVFFTALGFIFFKGKG